MEITQHARYTCTFCGKVNNRTNVLSAAKVLICVGNPSGLREAHSSWHLELRLMQKGYRRRRMDRLHNCCSYRSQVCNHFSVARALLRLYPSAALFVGCGKSPRHRVFGRRAFIHLYLLYAYKHNKHGQHDHEFKSFKYTPSLVPIRLGYVVGNSLGVFWKSE
jgi:hypothetical protein